MLCTVLRKYMYGTSNKAHGAYWASKNVVEATEN